MKRFAMTAYTGGVVFLGFWGKCAFDIGGIRSNEKLPALREHTRTAAVGVIDSIQKSAREVRASGFFLDSPDGVEVLSLIEQGFPFQCSICVTPEKVEELRQGDVSLVNGFQVEGPATIFRKSLLGEISFCSLGADSNTSVQIAASLKAGLDEWQTNPELRAAWKNNKESYLAYQKAVATGRVSICVPKTIKAAVKA